MKYDSLSFLYSVSLTFTFSKILCLCLFHVSSINILFYFFKLFTIDWKFYWTDPLTQFKVHIFKKIISCQKKISTRQGKKPSPWGQTMKPLPRGQAMKPIYEAKLPFHDFYVSFGRRSFWTLQLQRVCLYCSLYNGLSPIPTLPLCAIKSITFLNCLLNSEAHYDALWDIAFVWFSRRANFEIPHFTLKPFFSN